MRFKTEQTLFWDCAKACGGCSWSRATEYQPVEGWKAKPARVKVQRGELTMTYIVQECPEFVPDRKK